MILKSQKTKKILRYERYSQNPPEHENRLIGPKKDKSYPPKKQKVRKQNILQSKSYQSICVNPQKTFFAPPQLKNSPIEPKMAQNDPSRQDIKKSENKKILQKVSFILIMPKKLL